MFSIMQGDSYSIPIILKSGDIIITDELAEDVEITIGSLIKNYSSGEIFYDDGKWYFPLSQEETFRMKCMMLDAQVRVKFLQTGFVKGTHIHNFVSVYSISKEVL